MVESKSETVWLGGTTLSGMPRLRVRATLVRDLGNGRAIVRVALTGKRLEVRVADLHATSM